MSPSWGPGLGLFWEKTRSQTRPLGRGLRDHRGVAPGMDLWEPGRSAHSCGGSERTRCLRGFQEGCLEAVAALGLGAGEDVSGQGRKEGRGLPGSRTRVRYAGTCSCAGAAAGVLQVTPWGSLAIPRCQVNSGLSWWQSLMVWGREMSLALL